MKITKILSLMLAAVMMLAAFTACGSDGGDGNKTTTPETTAPVDNTPDYTYKRVVILGVDGMGAFCKDADTPNMDKIFAEGASTYGARTAFPSISAQSWGSLLIGSSAYAHGLNNSIVESNAYENGELPTIFKRVRDAMPDALLASYCDWNPINIGIVEDGIDVVKTTNKDAVLHEEVAAYLKDNDPTLMYVHFDSPDGAGHGNGYGSAKHLAQISTVDGYIGKIYDTLSEAGKAEDTLFIVVTDHGGTPEGSHGGYTDAEMNIFFGAVGKTVKKGSTIGEMNIRDVASVVLYALGIEIPKFDINGFSAQIPDGIFDGYTVPERQPIMSGDSSFTTLETPAKDSGKYITDLIGDDKVYSLFHFNDNAEDAMGKVTAEVDGTPKYYSTGYFGSNIELGEQGSVKLPGIIPEEGGFSLSLWFEHKRATTSEIVLYASRDTTDYESCGISAVYNGQSIALRADTGENAHETSIALSEMMPEGWTNLTVVFDRDARTITTYLNFEERASEKYSKRLTVSDYVNAAEFVLGNDPKGNFDSTNIMLDELVVFSTALSSDEIAKLAEYYSYEK